MVIFYDLITKDILYTEKEVITPILPLGNTEEKVEILNKQNIGFVGVNYEMNLEVFNYKVCINEMGEFIGLQPKGGELNA